MLINNYIIPFQEKIISSILLVEDKTLAIYIFGSYANGIPKATSDIDICVILPDENNISNVELINKINECFYSNIEDKIKLHIQLQKKTAFNIRAQLPTIAKVIYNSGICIYGNFSLEMLDNIIVVHKEYLIQMFLRIDNNIKKLNNYKISISTNDIIYCAYDIMMDCLRVFVMHILKEKPPYTNVPDKLLDYCISLDTRINTIVKPCQYISQLYKDIRQNELSMTHKQILQIKKYVIIIRNALPFLEVSKFVEYNISIPFDSRYLD
jgi:predicted nucleotidyltransferase